MKKKTVEEILSSLTDVPLYRVKADGNLYITKNEALQAMEEYHNQFIPTPAELEAMAVEKYPESLVKVWPFYNDENYEDRTLYLSALQDLVKIMGGDKG